jgi:hypothetical protein
VWSSHPLERERRIDDTWNSFQRAHTSRSVTTASGRNTTRNERVSCSRGLGASGSQRRSAAARDRERKKEIIKAGTTASGRTASPTRNEGVSCSSGLGASGSQRRSAAARDREREKMILKTGTSQRRSCSDAASERGGGGEIGENWRRKVGRDKSLQ